MAQGGQRFENRLARHPRVCTKNTFYLCGEHASALMHEDADMYVHLRIDTGEIVQFGLGSYSRSEDCAECNR